MYVYTYIFTHTHTPIHKCIRAYIHVCKHVRTRLRKYIPRCVCIYVHMGKQTYRYMHTHIYIYTHTFTYKYIYIYICTHIRTQIVYGFLSLASRHQPPSRSLRHKLARPVVAEPRAYKRECPTDKGLHRFGRRVLEPRFGTRVVFPDRPTVETNLLLGSKVFEIRPFPFEQVPKDMAFWSPKVRGPSRLNLLSKPQAYTNKSINQSINQSIYLRV